MASRMACRAFHTTRPLREPNERKVRLVESTNFQKKDHRRRLEAHQRLDKTIDPTSLSGTLEAHRTANRAELISFVPTRQSDPETIRPSFLDERDKDSATGALPVPGDHERHNKAVEEGQKRAVWSGPGGRLHRTNRSLHATRIKYLRKHEEPLGPLPTGEDRAAQSDVMRRLSVILQQRQSKQQTRGQVLGLNSWTMQYEGTYVPLKPVMTKAREPWARRPPGFPTGYQLLENEMKLFERWMLLTREETAAREAVHERIREVIKEKIPHYAVEMFGSQTTGLALPTSDMDLRLFPPPVDIAAAMSPTEEELAAMSTTEEELAAVPPTEEDVAAPAPSEDVPTDLATALKSASNPAGPNPFDQDQTLKTMLGLQETLANHPDFSRVVFHGGRFPLIGVTHTPSGLPIQLVSSKVPTSPSRRAIKAYLARHRHLRPIYTVVKTALDLRGLSDVWTGGLGSYAIFMMVVAALQHLRRPRDSMARQLLGVLKFWSDFNTDGQGVSIEPPVLFPKKMYPTEEEKLLRVNDQVLYGRLRIGQPRYYHRYMLCLQDPADPFNDLGKRSFAIKDVQATFRDIHAGLLKDINNPNIISQDRPLLRRLVGRCDKVYDGHRTRVELYGDDFVKDDVRTEETEAEAGTMAAETEAEAEADEKGPAWLS